MRWEMCVRLKMSKVLALVSDKKHVRLIMRWEMCVRLKMPKVLANFLTFTLSCGERERKPGAASAALFLRITSPPMSSVKLLDRCLRSSVLLCGMDMSSASSSALNRSYERRQKKELAIISLFKMPALLYLENHQSTMHTGSASATKTINQSIKHCHFQTCSEKSLFLYTVNANKTYRHGWYSAKSSSCSHSNTLWPLQNSTVLGDSITGWNGNQTSTI